jgi:hypothetical protein
MKEIKVNYENCEDLTWYVNDYTIEDGKLIYSVARDNSINIIKLDKIISIIVDGKIVYDKYMDSFKKQLDNYLKTMHHNRIVDIDIWNDDSFYCAVVVEISENHMIYRYSYYANRMNDDFKLKLDTTEVF